MSKEIAKHCFTVVVNSASLKNLEGHMEISSGRVSLRGVPGSENVDHDAWYAR